MSKDEEQNRGTGREVKVEQGTIEDMVTLNRRFYNEVAGSSRERCSIGSVQQVVKNDSFCGNNRRDIGRRTGETFPG